MKPHTVEIPSPNYQIIKKSIKLLKKERGTPKTLHLGQVFYKGLRSSQDPHPVEPYDQQQSSMIHKEKKKLTYSWASGES